MSEGRPHQSHFSYNLTQPYPFRWFTPVVVVGFILATVLFSLLNFATNGLYLVNEVSSDPNATVSEKSWWNKWPSSLSGSRMQAFCQPALLSTQSTISTNSTALTYVITGFSTRDGKVLSTIDYNNNGLQNCSIDSIGVSFSSFDRSANQLAFAQWGPVVTTYIQCLVEGTEGTRFINLTNTYDYVPDGVALTRRTTFLGTGFLEKNVTHANLWWGESLMSFYWNELASLLQAIHKQDIKNKKDLIRKGTLLMSRNASLNIVDITSLDFFDVDFLYVTEGDAAVDRDAYNNSTSIAYLNSNASRPNVWVTADNLAKSSYSTVLADLGQAPTDKIQNIVTDPALLQYFTMNFTTILANYTLSRRGFTPPFVYSVPGPEQVAFNSGNAAASNVTSSLYPSVISASYLCQIPKLKSAGNLFVSILVADLVFLRVLWTIFKFVVDTFVVEKPAGTSNHLEDGTIQDGDRSKFSRTASHDDDNEHELTSIPSQLPQKARSIQRNAYYRQISSQDSHTNLLRA